MQELTLRIVAAVVHDSAGRLLLVRKRGTTAFMQPGGKIEPGEEPAAALVRELEEELGLRMLASALTEIGRFTAPAANEPGWSVDATVFALTTDDDVAAAAEIEELRWLAPGEDVAGIDIAPLTRDQLLGRFRPAVGPEGLEPPTSTV